MDEATTLSGDAACDAAALLERFGPEYLAGLVDAVPELLGRRRGKASQQIENYLRQRKRNVDRLRPLWRAGDANGLRIGRMKYGPSAVARAVGCAASTVNECRAWRIVVGQYLFPATHAGRFIASEQLQGLVRDAMRAA